MCAVCVVCIMCIVLCCIVLIVLCCVVCRHLPPPSVCTPVSFILEYSVLSTKQYHEVVMYPSPPLPRSLIFPPSIHPPTLLPSDGLILPGLILPVRRYVRVPITDVFPVHCQWSDVELGSLPCAYGTAENMVRNWLLVVRMMNGTHGTH